MYFFNQSALVEQVNRDQATLLTSVEGDLKATQINALSRSKAIQDIVDYMAGRKWICTQIDSSATNEVALVSFMKDGFPFRVALTSSATNVDADYIWGTNVQERYDNNNDSKVEEIYRNAQEEMSDQMFEEMGY